MTSKLNITEQTHQLAAQFQVDFSKELCSIPKELKSECTGIIIDAHAVQRACLVEIARDNQVYAFVPSLYDLKKSNGVLHPKLKYVKSASTFSGFCGFHDNNLFQPVEDVPFTSSLEQCFLLNYRSFSREFYFKNAAYQNFLNLRKRVAKKPPHDQARFYVQFSGYEKGLKSAVKWMAEKKESIDNYLLNADYSKLKAFIISLPKPIPIMCSATFSPTQDFTGTKLQDLNDLEKTPQFLDVTSFSSEGKGYIVCSWFEDSDAVCLPFITTLDKVTEEKMSSALARMLFEYSDSLYLSPDWWDELSEEYRANYIKRMNTDPSLGHPEGCLTSDEFPLPKWEISSKSWVSPEPSAR